MKRLINNSFVWAIAGVLIALMARAPGKAAHAQTAGGPPLTFNYTDSAGPGCLALASLGDDGNGGTAYSMTLTQNGTSWTGAGNGWVISSSAPRTTALAFWLTDGNGTDLFFQGTLQMGVDTLSGQGTWTELQDPSVTDQWNVFHMVPSRGPCA